MKIFPYAAALFLAAAIPSPVVAATPTTEEVELCVAMGELAEVVMLARQAGQSYATLYQTAQKNSDPTVRDLTTTMVETAFTVERYASERYRLQAAQDFRNLWEGQCIETMSSKQKGYW